MSSNASFDIPLDPFLEPHVEGHDRLFGPAFAFLIEHPSGKKCLFDLSIIKNLSEYTPKLREMLSEPEITVTTEKDVIECLREHGVTGTQINEIIWSHWHWDQYVAF